MASFKAAFLNFHDVTSPTVSHNMTKFNGLRAISRPTGLRHGSAPSAQPLPVLRISCAVAEPSILEKVQQVIAKQLSVEASEVTPEAKFSDLGADSLDTVEIMMNLEESFHISIAEDGANNVVTVADAANMIQELVFRNSDTA